MKERKKTENGPNDGSTGASDTTQRGKRRLAKLKENYLDRATLAAIRAVLCMPAGAPFPRCRARAWKRIKREFEAKGDFSHSGKHHVCAVCRCQNTAGWGTKGDFYGLGEHTGHFGVGFCIVHERSKRGGHSYEMAQHHMKALQQYGQGESARQEMELMERVATEEAETKIECRRGLKALLEQLEIVEKQLKQNSDQLREYVHGRLAPMSDKTKMDLLIRLADRTAAIEKIVHDILPGDAVSVDEVRVRIKQTMALTERVLMDEKTSGTEKKTLWLQGFKEIWVAPLKRK